MMSFCIPPIAIHNKRNVVRSRGLFENEADSLFIEVKLLEGGSVRRGLHWIGLDDYMYIVEGIGIYIGAGFGGWGLVL
jgi:hypothetical protein